MSSLPSPPLPDETTHVATDAPCVTCGYNLRTLALDGRCPECATPVWDSLHGFYLHYASPAWVRGLARGLLLALCALGAMVVITPVIVLLTGFWGFVTNPGAYLTVPAGAIWANALTQFLVQGLCTGLLMLGLVWLSRPDPRGRESIGVGRARCVLRWGTWLLPLPIVGNLVLAWALPPLPPLTPGAPPPAGWAGQWMSTYVLLGFLAGLAGLVIYGVTLLALLRRIAHLVQRIPRPKLARAARVTFWGLLASGGLLFVGYAAMLLLMLPTMSAAFAAVGTAATTTSVSVGPLGPSVSVTTRTAGGRMPWTHVGPPAVRDGSDPASEDVEIESPADSAAAAVTLSETGLVNLPASAPASGPTSVPTTLPVPGAPFFTGAILGGCGAGLGGCGSVIFGITVIVVLIRACSALFAAARLAKALAPIPSRDA